MSTTTRALDRREFLRRAFGVFALLAAPEALLARAAAACGDPGNFRRIYLDPELRARFFLFLRNIFHLYPEEKFSGLILELCQTLKTDEEIYRALLKRIPEIKPALAGV